MTRFAFRWLHPDVGAWVARKVSKTPTHTGGPSSKQKARSAFLEEWAGIQLATRPELELVVLGHTHVPVLKELFPERYYLNAGDWLMNQSYAVFSQDQPPRLMDWRDGRALETPG